MMTPCGIFTSVSLFCFCYSVHQHGVRDGLERFAHFSLQTDRSRIYIIAVMYNLDGFQSSCFNQLSFVIFFSNLFLLIYKFDKCYNLLTIPG